MSIRVGIVSFAHMHAYAYASALGSLGNAEFVGVADEDAVRGREAAGRYGVRFFDGLAQLLPEVEAVVICTENREHLRYAANALEHGVNVLCEKPIATKLEDAVEMVRTARASDSQLGIAFPVRYVSAVRQAKQAIAAGAIGRALAVNGTNHGQLPGGWFTDPDAAGGGAVMDHTVHVADLLRWIFGMEVQSVYAEIDSRFGNGDIDDCAILTLELADGVNELFATIDPSWSRGKAYPTWGDVTLQITGTQGVIEVDAFGATTTVYGQEFPATEWLDSGEDMNALMLEDFLSGVRDGSLRGASAIDGLRALEVVLAAYRSSRTGQAEPVEHSDVGP